MNQDCQDLRDFLGGTLEVEYFSDIERLRQHGGECEECQALLPDSISEIDHIERTVVQRIRTNITRLYRQYKLDEQLTLYPADANKAEPLRIIVKKEEAQVIPFTPAPPTSVKDAARLFCGVTAAGPDDLFPEEARLLSLLANAGEKIRAHLQVLNDNWGLCGFCVAPYRGSCEYESRVCGPLIDSLSQEVQLFVFRAVLAADILSLFREGLPAHRGPAIYLTIETAAPAFLGKYLDEQRTLMEAPSNHPGTQESSEKLGRMFERLSHELERNFEDLSDSLKAVQGTPVPRIESSAVDEEKLSLSMGPSLWRRLSVRSKEYIRQAEASFAIALDTGDYRLVFIDLLEAYNVEFRQAITKPLVQTLVKRGKVNYGDPRHPLIQNGEASNSLTLGMQLWYLRNDPDIRSIVSGLGFDVDGIYGSATALNAARRKAAHGEISSSRAEAERVREMIIGTGNILKLLFPAAKAADA